MAKNLTENQKEWLDLFFNEASGDAKQATEMSSYAEGTNPATIVGSLQEEISRRTQELISAAGTKAFFKMVDVLDKPGQLGSQQIIAAAKDLLDRSGHGKTDKMEIKTDNPLFVLPAKEKS